MEDYILYFGVAAIIGIITLALSFFLKTQGEAKPAEAPERAQAGPDRGARNVPQRRVGGRQRRRIADSDDEAEQDERHEEAAPVAADTDEELEAKLNDPKLGAKKREKLLQKAEKKAQREAEERSREDKRAREAKREEERRKFEEAEAEEEKKRIEEEKRLKEEKEKRELEEYMELRKQFTVETEGCDVADENAEENLLEKFVEHIKAKKVILFEELASQFSLKVPDAIQRLNQLVEMGRITGVMDDRGKFIYISEEELAKFAKFIKQRGRVSIAEIVENSTSIVNIVPDTEVAAQ